MTTLDEIVARNTAVKCLTEIAAELKKANTLKTVELKLKFPASSGVWRALPDNLKSAFAEAAESI